MGLETIVGILVIFVIAVIAVKILKFAVKTVAIGALIALGIYLAQQLMGFSIF